MAQAFLACRRGGSKYTPMSLITLLHSGQFGFAIFVLESASGNGGLWKLFRQSKHVQCVYKLIRFTPLMAIQHQEKIHSPRPSKYACKSSDQGPSKSSAIQPLPTSSPKSKCERCSTVTIFGKGKSIRFFKSIFLIEAMRFCTAIIFAGI
jgi:hypothetical protein